MFLGVVSPGRVLRRLGLVRAETTVGGGAGAGAGVSASAGPRASSKKGASVRGTTSAPALPRRPEPVDPAVSDSAESSHSGESAESVPLPVPEPPEPAPKPAPKPEPESVELPPPEPVSVSETAHQTASQKSHQSANTHVNAAMNVCPVLACKPTVSVNTENCTIRVRPRRGPTMLRLKVKSRAPVAGAWVAGQLSTRSVAVSPEYIAQVSDAIKSVFPINGYDDGSLAPVILRLAWHCCGTYDAASDTGGSNGSTMRFLPEITDEANFGLDIARSALEPVKQQFPRITYADLWTLAGKLAVEHMGGPTITWKGGRVDCKKPDKTPPNGRLPFAYKDAQHVRTTFGRMGFNAQETVALLGCHAVGRCHKRISGWDGKWTDDPVRFSNAFYTALLHESWVWGSVPETGKGQFYSGDKRLMMLNTDMELVRDPEFRSWVERYAADERLFFAHFAAAFARLLELGIHRA